MTVLKLKISNDEAWKIVNELDKRLKEANRRVSIADDRYFSIKDDDLAEQFANEVGRYHERMSMACRTLTKMINMVNMNLVGKTAEKFFALKRKVETIMASAEIWNDGQVKIYEIEDCD